MNHLSIEPLIKVVAKTGFITKSLWIEFFFAGNEKRWRNRSWANLRESGTFLPYAYNFKEPTLILNKRNKIVRSIVGGHLVHPPSSQNFQHDQILFQGLFRLMGDSQLTHWRSESELKLFAPSDYRIETQGQLIKFPDLILSVRTQSGVKAVALELERTQKSKKRYIQIFNAYASMKGINTIVCAVENPMIAKSIEGALRETYFPTSERPVLIMSEDEWKNKPAAFFNRLGTSPTHAPEGLISSFA